MKGCRRLATDPRLHQQAKGWLLCPTCGHMLEPPAPVQPPRGGRRNVARRGGVQQNGGHADDCPHRGSSPQPVAMATAARVEVLRLLVPVPPTRLGQTKASPGACHSATPYSTACNITVMLDTSELDFELEGPWNTGETGTPAATLSLAFIDPSLGGSGYLARLAEQFHPVAGGAIEHLDHPSLRNRLLPLPEGVSESALSRAPRLAADASDS